MNSIGQILPVDGYLTSIKGTMPADYAKSLTHMYQPLIGIHAVSLYQTLLHDMDLQEVSEPQTHHTLMNYLNLPLDEIYHCRRKLEGIGLLKTYKQTLDTCDLYTYELQSPFDAESFFRDAMLSELLFHHLGEQRFKTLRSQMMRQHAERGLNITASFNEVFQTFTPTGQGLEGMERNSPPEEEPSIDFTWMEQMLKQRMIPQGKVLTVENKRLISQMMVLYDLDTHEIDKSVLWALTDENLLNAEEFKSACHDLFKSKNRNRSIRLTESVKAVPKTDQTVMPASKEEMLIRELETISPKQLLEDLSSGNHASEQDMKAIREVMTTQGLPAPVMNVLIHYVLLQTNMKLSKAYLEKIASHWSRANIHTAREAMKFAKKEQEKFQENMKKKAAPYNRQQSREIIPDWFKERKKAQAPVISAASSKELAKEQERIAARLKQYSNGN